MAKDYRKILNRFKTAKARSSHYDALYDDAFKYAQPDKEGLSHLNTIDSSEGSNNTIHLYDNTLAESTDKFASRMANILFPYGEKVAKYRFMEMAETFIKNKDQGEERLKQVNINLDIIADIIYQNLYSSNFYPTLNESLKDFAIGTGAFIINKTGNIYNPFNFTSIHPNNLYIEESADGLPRSVFREYRKSVEAFKDLYPDAKITESMKKMLIEDPTTRVNVKECCLYNTSNKSPTKYTFYVFVDDVIVYEENYNYNPFIVFRAPKLSGEIKGRGPALLSVADARVLNAAVKNQIKAAEKSVSEIYLISTNNSINPKLSSLKNKDGTITIADDLVIPVNDMEGFKRLPMEAKPVVINENLINTLRFNIRNRMLASTVERSDSITRSPEEIMAINNETYEDLNATRARTELELINPTIEAVVNILLEYGLLDQPISNILQLIEFDDVADLIKLLKVSYTSPIARAQQIKEVNNFIQATQTIMGTLGQENAMKFIDIPKVIHDVYDKYDVNTEWFLSIEEMRNMIRQEQEQQQQMMQQMMQQQQQVNGEQGDGGEQ